MTWSPGDPVVLREVWRGRIWTARPVTVVEDRQDQQAFFVPSGIHWMCPASSLGEQLRLPADDWVLEARPWDGTLVLSFAWPGVAHAILLVWSPTGEFLRWYVNLQEPLRRTKIGFDYMDHALDIVGAPDLSSWSWKDEDELEEAVRRGLFSAEQARGFRAEGQRAVGRILRQEPPFDLEWRDWRPDPAWPTPELPPGWDVLD